MFDYIGLGVNLDLDENVTKKVDPIIRDIERLKRQMRSLQKTQSTLAQTDDVFYNPRQRRYMRDYNASMQSLDKTLINISERFVRATYDANNLSKAINRMQFTGNFNRLHSNIMRTQTMLGRMGYAMSGQQKSASDLQAYDMMNYRIKDLNERISLTTKGLRDMEKAGDVEKYPEQYRLATESLRLMNEELVKAGSLQKKLADTHGYGLTRFLGKDILYNPANTISQSLANRALGASMTDMALASKLAYSSLDRTSNMMVGMGYTTMEARMKLNRLAMQLQMTGMALTQFATVPLAMATAGIGILLDRYESASNIMSARALMPVDEIKQYERAMRDIAVDTGMTQMQVAEAMSLSHTLFNDKGGFQKVIDQTERAMFVGKVYGTSHEKVMRDITQITDKYGVSNEKAWDMYVAGAIEAKKQTGKGFTGMKGLDRIMDTIEESPDKFKKLTEATGQYNDAYERMVQNAERGIMEGLIEGFLTLGTSVIEVVKANEGWLTRLTQGFHEGTLAVVDFLRANEKLAKILGITGMIVLGVGMLAGPVALMTGLMVRYKNVIGGVIETVGAFNKGGFAVVSPQAKMARDLLHSMTVAFARLPQTILFSAIPALYTFARGIPGLLVNMARMNPLVTGLTLGIVAYSKNLLGFKDLTQDVVKSVTNTFQKSNEIISRSLNFEDVDLTAYGKWEGRLAKITGFFKLLPKVAKSAISGTKLQFTPGEFKLLDNLGIEGQLLSVAKGLDTLNRTFQGVKTGAELGLKGLKSFFGYIWDIAYPVIDKFTDRILDVANFIGKTFFGGKGDAKSITDLVDGLSDGASKAEKFGFYLGLAMTTLLGFKTVSWLTGAITKPFISARNFITLADAKLSTFQKRLLSLPTKKNVMVTATTVGPVPLGGGKGGKGGFGPGAGGGTWIFPGTPESKDKGPKGGGKKGKLGNFWSFLSFKGLGGKIKGAFKNEGGNIWKLMAPARWMGKLGGLLGAGLLGAFKIGLRAIPYLGWALLAWDAVSLVFSNWDSIKNAGSKAWEWIKTDGMKYMGDFFTFLWDSAKDSATWIGEKFSETWDGIKTYSSNKWNEATTYMSSIWGVTTNYMKDLWNGAVSAISGETKSMYDGINLIGQSTWNKVTEYAKGQFSILSSDALSKGQQTGINLRNGIMSQLGGIGASISSMLPTSHNIRITSSMGQGPVSSTTSSKLQQQASNKVKGTPFENKYRNSYMGFARGGIVDRPTPGVFGEDGMEAIIPLSPGKRDRASSIINTLTDQYGIKNTAYDEAKKGSGNSSGKSGGDINIEKIAIEVIMNGEPNSQNVGGVAKELVSKFISELKKQYKIEQMRGRGKNLTFEEFVLNY